MKKVLIGIPTRGCDIFHGLVAFLLRQQDKKNPRVDVVFSRCGTSANHAEESLFQELARTDYDYLMMIDSDVAPPLGTLEILMADDKDIIGAPVWHFDASDKDIHLGVHIINDNARRLYFMRKGVQQVHYTSYSCMLVKKKVAMGFHKAKEEFVYMSKLIPKWNTKQNTDSIFFAKARKLGFEVWVDWDIKGIVHRRPIDLSDPVLEKFVSKRFVDLELAKAIYG